MTGITHKQAHRYLRADLDGLLRDKQRRDLNTHLRDCEACRVESESFATLTERLQTNFHTRWDTQDGPSENVLTNIQSQKRRIIMSNRINVGLKTFAGAAALLLLGLLFIPVIRQLREYSKQNNSAPGSTSSISQPYNGLIAFASETKKGNNKGVDVFTMSMDGNDIANLTNNPAINYYPAWSPDGHKIAFISNRTGKYDVFIMNSDGSELTQLTDNPGNVSTFSWSPNGQKIVYSLRTEDNTASQLIIMNPDGSNKITLTKEAGDFLFLSWSPDEQTVIYQDATDPNGSSANVGIYSVNIDGSDQQKLFEGGGISSIRWEDARNFSGIVYTQLDNANWYLYRFNLDGKPAEQLSGSPTPMDGWLIEGSRIIYITKNNTTWFWHDNQKKISDWPKWNFASACKEYSPIDVYTHDATYAASPDGKRLFVIVTCNEGLSLFYLVSADGMEIKELANMSTPATWQTIYTNWSPDGKHVIMTSAVAEPSNESAYMDFYLFDIENMLNDPSTKPIQLTTDGAFKYGVSWQPNP